MNEPGSLEREGLAALDHMEAALELLDRIALPTEVAAHPAQGGASVGSRSARAQAAIRLRRSSIFLSLSSLSASQERLPSKGSFILTM